MPELRLTETVGHVCSEDCTTDADCPASMHCVGIHYTVVPTFAPKRPPDALACTPRQR